MHNISLAGVKGELCKTDPLIEEKVELHCKANNAELNNVLKDAMKEVVVV